MSDLPTLNTRYRDVNPWFDLRDYLVNGWRSRYTPTCGATVGHNVVHWSMQLSAAESTDRVVMDPLPEWLRPHTTQTLIGFAGGEPILVDTDGLGRLAVAHSQRHRVIGVDTILSITGTTSRVST